MPMGLSYDVISVCLLFRYAGGREAGVGHFQLQRVLAGTKDKSDAFAVMEDVLAPYQNMPEAHITLAISALLKKDSARAQDEAKKALALKPDSEMAVLTYAQTVSNTTEATAIMYAFLEKYPGSREVRTSLARLLVGQKLYDRARHQFEILLETEPDDLTALYSLGLLAIQQNSPQKSAQMMLHKM